MALQPTPPTENQTAQNAQTSTSRIFACGKCGSPITVYPPDDIHKVASRQRSSFLEAVESVGICAKCNETNLLYWGRPVPYRILVLLSRRIVTGLKNVLRILPLSRITHAKSTETADEPPVMSDEERDQIESRLIDYISENGGAIAPGKAAEELGIPIELVNESIERMKEDGRLAVQPPTQEIQV